LIIRNTNTEGSGRPRFLQENEKRRFSKVTHLTILIFPFPTITETSIRQKIKFLGHLSLMAKYGPNEPRPVLYQVPEVQVTADIINGKSTVNDVMNT
jgi:hypothetical protein